MNKSIILLICLFTVLSVKGKVVFGQDRLPLIPEPVEVKELPGNFNLSSKTKLVVPSSDKKVLKVADQFSRQLFALSGISTEISTTTKRQAKRTVALALNKTNNSRLGDEGYTLEVSSRQIRISANKPVGLFYGVQTLLQLIPAQRSQEVSVPYMNILDYPRFAWRGLMLDVSRHFFNKNEVKQFIDQMVKYKFTQVSQQQ